jgi:hypothetical protein
VKSERIDGTIVPPIRESVSEHACEHGCTAINFLIRQNECRQDRGCHQWVRQAFTLAEAMRFSRQMIRHCQVDLLTAMDNI